MSIRNFSLLLFAAFATACSDEDVNVNSVTHNQKQSEVVLSFDLAAYQDEITSLDSLQSIDIPVKVIENGYISKMPSTRAGEIIAVVGTVTNLGNKTTLFNYGVGENLVPYYYCGSTLNYATISTVYKVSYTYELNDNYAVRGYTGEYSGWNGTRIPNPQVRWQGENGDTEHIEFYTYVYDIKSTIQGYSAGEHCWVPVNTNDVRIYARIYE